MTRIVKQDLGRIWSEYRSTHAVELRNRLVEYYMPLVRNVSEIVSRRLWPRVTADELASAGYDGLINAVTSFNPDRGVKFETYCRQRILGAIRDWQREIDPLGRSGRSFERTVSAIEDRMIAQNGAPPDAEVVARQLGVPPVKFSRMKRAVMASHSVSLEPPAERNDDSRAGMLMPADPGPSPTDQTERELIREYILRGLREQDRLILTLYYYERLTMAEIGGVLGVSESRVCQRHAEILIQLRNRFRSTPCDLVA